MATTAARYSDAGSGRRRRGVQRTVLKKAYRRRCPGLPWPGTPGVTEPQIRADTRYAHTTSTSGLTHYQLLDSLLANRPVPRKSALRVPIPLPIEECAEPSEVDAAPFVAVKCQVDPADRSTSPTAEELQLSMRTAANAVDKSTSEGVSIEERWRRLVHRAATNAGRSAKNITSCYTTAA